MTNNKSQSRHRDVDKPLQKTTVSHHSAHRYETLARWADAHNLKEAFDAVYLILGCSETLIGIRNFCQEFDHPDAKALVSSWSDHPALSLVRDLLSAVGSSPEIQDQFPPISPYGSADKTKRQLQKAGADIQRRNFLLLLIVNPLAAADNHETYSLRRSLRLWLLVKSLEHLMDSGCFADEKIRAVANFLVRDTDDPAWNLIDKCLWTVNRLVSVNQQPFSTYSMAVKQAVNELSPAYSGDRSATMFLNALLSVATGACRPIPANEEVGLPVIPEFASLKSQKRALLDSVEAAPDSTGVEVIIDDEADAPSDSRLLLFADDPEKSWEQQQLTGKSILVQSTELTHYLPWSWEKPLPIERPSLFRWVENELHNDSISSRFGAACVWLAIRFGRSLPYVLEFTVDEDASAEWSTSGGFRSARRQIVRRHNSWSPNDESIDLIEPFANLVQVDLPEQITTALASARASTMKEVTTIGDLWAGCMETASPEVWFNRQAKKHFPRVKSAMLANLGPQTVFEGSGDSSLARLLFAHPRSALPAACGYSNWDIAVVESGFNLPVQSEANSVSSRTNTLGSVLAPLKSVIREAVNSANRKLAAAAESGFIKFHNTFARFCVSALYAGTGCRHLRDPFESIEVFCFDPPSVFINDKHDGHLHSGRMVPLPDQCVALVKVYLGHLVNLSEMLEGLHPELARQVQLLTVQSSDYLPLFFQLDANLCWHSLNTTGLPGETLFDWPLPPNVFRHRYAQQLARHDVENEVIDGWMGHAERGAATYGDTSPRSWLDDYLKHRESLNAIFDDLGFKVPTVPPALIDDGAIRAADIHRELSPAVFGQRARSAKRQEVSRIALRTVKDEVRVFLEGRSVNDLDHAEVEALSTRMLLRDNGLPHPQAVLRYSFLMKLLGASGSVAKKRLRYKAASINEERSLISETCPLALRLWPSLEQWADRNKASNYRSELSKSHSLMLGIVLLVIRKRLTYRRLLIDLLHGQNYRLIRHNNEVFLEYSESLEPDDFMAPVQRHRIDGKIASLLDAGYAIKKQVDADKTSCPPVLESLSMLLWRQPEAVQRSGGLTFGGILQRLIELAEQVNLVTLPGIVAAGLSERRPPTSMSLVDHIRVQDGVVLQPPVSEEEKAVLSAGAPLPRHSVKYVEKETLQAHAKQFLDGLRVILSQYQGSRRRDTVRLINRYCRQHSHQVSTAIVWVGYWIAYRTERGKGQHRKQTDPYAAGSLLRYLSALSGPFSGLAYDVDITSLDENSATGLCADMFSLKEAQDRERDYFGARLVEFFQWAEKHGVAQPEWEELDFGPDRRRVKPGVFSESDYHSMMRKLLTSPDQIYGLYSAFVLLLAYRFGCRSQEALGLEGRDWCEADGFTWILVRNNRYRSLKRGASRRAVPLVFNLSDIEQQVTRRVIERYENVFGDDEKQPLLFDIIDGRVDQTKYRELIPEAVALVAKSLTGNSTLSLHHARHSFYNQLAPALFRFSTKLSMALSGFQDDDAIHQIVLGDDRGPSRRAAMGISRAMGHTGPKTGFRNYFHQLTEWADALTPADNDRFYKLRNAYNTANWTPKKTEAVNSSFTEIKFENPSFVRLLGVLHRVAMGHSYEAAGSAVRLQPSIVRKLRRIAESANARMRFKAIDSNTMTRRWFQGSEFETNMLLMRRDGEAWVRMQGVGEKVDKMNESLQIDGVISSDPVQFVSNLIGRNGHILMDEPDHYGFIRFSLKTLRVPEFQYIALAKHMNSIAMSRLESHGFSIAAPTDPETGVLRQLDPYVPRDSGGEYSGRTNSGIIFYSGQYSPIWHREELIVLILVMAIIISEKSFIE